MRSEREVSTSSVTRRGFLKRVGAAAEVSAGAGHDIFSYGGSGGPHLYEKHAVDLSSLVIEVEKKHGKVHQIGRQIAYNEGTNAWSALPAYYISFPGLYRKDLWDEIGMKPDTWEDIRVGGAKLKAKGTPIGIGLGHSVDPNLSYRSMLWSYGASECDETGKRVTLNSKETLEVVKLVRALYKEAMEPEVLSWDDASNNRFLASGRGSWIHNPISAYRSIEAQNKDLADKIWVQLSPKGPVQRRSFANCRAYGITKFSKNADGATAFLEALTDSYRDG